ncbi:nucleotidyltransferase family protein [Cyanobium sp. HWJ4-Hawea]|uniref:nucleotidyltransferase family protein n=1 Tax=unclassified Cyanobium TaxID=2627006 RepID=UPI0020CD0F59|nr:MULTISPECIES: nucleotidyltransferase family protein [unclassified Cyanobium]MCP9774937.1 nucleotidyltransferase family protein [Cyanobium sp. WAJ14-Wanaka]MCP9809392.1 nucleotidyltransferase family protein [Cyanobium sp. HWJ4-Hawea]
MNPVDLRTSISRDQVVALLTQHLPEWRRLYGIQELALFGSMARNQASENSDVDLCVSLDPPNPFALVHFQQAVQQQLGRRVDVVTRWPGMNPALMNEIQQDAISI